MTVDELKKKHNYDKMSSSEQRDFNKWLRERHDRLERDRQCAEWANDNPDYHKQTYFFGD